MHKKVFIVILALASYAALHTAEGSDPYLAVQHVVWNLKNQQATEESFEDLIQRLTPQQIIAPYEGKNLIQHAIEHNRPVSACALLATAKDFVPTTEMLDRINDKLQDVGYSNGYPSFTHWTQLERAAHARRYEGKGNCSACCTLF